MNKLVAILEYLLVSVIIIEFNTPYLIYDPLKKGLPYIAVFVTLMLVLLTSRIDVNKNNMHYQMLFVFGSLFPLLYAGNKTKFLLLFVIFIILLWTYLINRKAISQEKYYSLFYRYSNIVSVIAIISFSFWIYASLLERMTPTGVFPSTWTEGGFLKFINTYYYIYFETQYYKNDLFECWRNSAIFQEGPMYNMILCTALSIECFLNESKSWFRSFKIIIFIISIISTITTTGQIYLIILCLIYHKKLTGFIKSPILKGVLFSVVVYGMYLAVSFLLEMKTDTTSGERSVDIRNSSINDCIRVGMENPVFGSGIFVKEMAITEHSNSLFEVFAYGGFYGLLLYVSSFIFIPFLYYLKSKTSNWTLALILYFGVFSITVSEFKLLTLLFIAFGLSRLGNMYEYKDIYTNQNE